MGGTEKIEVDAGWCQPVSTSINYFEEIFLENDDFIGSVQRILVIVVHVFMNGRPTAYQGEFRFKFLSCGLC